MRDKTTFCDHCGAKTVSYGHSLSRGLVGAMLVFSRLGEGPHLLSASQVNISQYNNFQKLKYFGLVEKAGEGPHSGIWRITYLGWAFLRGEHNAPKRVRTYRGEVTEVDTERVLFKDIDLTKFWEKHEDYVASARGEG